MKNLSKFLFWGLLPMTLAFGQCSKSDAEAPPPFEEGTVTITLRTPSTRTSLENDSKVCWSPGDKVLINNQEYEVIPDKSDLSIATIPDVIKSSSYTAIYPTNSMVDADLSAIRVRFYPIQGYAENSFSKDANPMVAYSTTTELAFKNLAGIIRVAITGSGTLSSVILEGNNQENLAGELLLPLADLQSGNLAAQIRPSGGIAPSQTIQVDCSNNVVALSQTPTYIYIVVPAINYSQGFRITVATTEGLVGFQSTSKAVEVDRSTIKDMEPFTFTPRAELMLEVGAPTATSIPYSVKAAPNTSILTLVLLASLWEELREANPDISEAELNLYYLNRYGALAEVDQTGSCVVTATSALGPNGFANLLASTEYKLLSSYCAAATSIGNVAQAVATTAAPEGSAPELTITPVPLASPYHQIMINIQTKDAAGVRCFLFGKAEYDAYIADGKTDTDLLTEFGYALVEESLALANTSTGANWSFSKLSSGSPFTLLVMASGSGGKNTIVKQQLTTPLHFDPATPWSIVSTTATFTNGIFDVFDLQGYDIPNLTVEKIDGKDIFRVADVFSTKHTPVFAELGFVDLDGGPYYLIIDAQNPQEVRVEVHESAMGIENIYYANMYSLTVCSPALLNSSLSPDYPLGTYDSATGVLNLGKVVMLTPNGFYPTTIPSVLRLNPANSGGLSTEDFTKEAPTGW